MIENFIQRLIKWLIKRYYPEFILIHKDEIVINDITENIQNETNDDIKATLNSEMYNNIIALTRYVESTGSKGEFKRINVITAIRAERRKRDLPEWPERDINLAIELAIREL